MDTIIITSDTTFSVNSKPYRVVESSVFTPGYDDFAPHIVETREDGTLLLDLGKHRLLRRYPDGDIEQITSDVCQHFVVAPIEVDESTD